MIEIGRDKERHLIIIADLDWDKKKRDWTDGLYVSVTNASAHIYFSKKAEERLKQLLKKEE